MFYKIKKAIGPVIATALLLVVAVISVFGFQNWFQTYSISMFSDVEKNTDISSFEIGSTNLINGILYFNSPSNNFTITNIKVGSINCDYSNILNKGINEIDISNCLKNNNGIKNVVVYTNKNIYENFFNIDYSCSGYCTSLNFTNDVGKLFNEQVYFYVNYTTDDYNFSGVGFTKNYIGRVIWNTSDLGVGTSFVKSVDLTGDGIRNQIVVGDKGYPGKIHTFFNDGNSYWDSSSFNGILGGIKVGNLVGDSKDEIIIGGDSSSGLRVYNSDGSLYWLNLSSFIGAIELRDLNNDGKEEIVTGNSSNLLIFNSNGSLFLKSSSTINSFPSELDFGDFNSDGNSNDIAIAVRSGSYNILYVFDSNGNSLWDTGNTLLNSGYQGISLKSIDIDKNGFNNYILVGDNYFVRLYNSIGSNVQSFNEPANEINEINVLDLNNDGYDDFIVTDSSSIYAYYNNLSLAWSFSHPSKTYSLNTDFLNLDGSSKIYLGDSLGDLVVIDKSGNLIWDYNIGLGSVGTTISKSPGIDISDINLDGDKDILVTSQTGYLSILQNVDCKIRFQDGTFNLDWNNNLNQWEYNRTFSSSGTYDYTIICDKSGYQLQNKQGSVIIG